MPCMLATLLASGLQSLWYHLSVLVRIGIVCLCWIVWYDSMVCMVWHGVYYVVRYGLAKFNSMV
jgi:hypothetical protein